MVRGAAKGVSQAKKEARDLAKAKSVKRDSAEVIPHPFTPLYTLNDN